MSDARSRITVGVTGGVACGKSEVGRILAAHGVAVCDADTLVHRALAPGGPLCAAAVEQFGAEALRSDGAADRARIARIVFGDPTALAAWNARAHPIARRALQEWLDALPADRDAAALVPLLFEAGWTDGWTATICVAASPATVRERWARRGWSDEVGRRRQEAQWPLEEKIRRADYVIRNDGSLEELERATLRVWQSIRGRER